MLPYLTHKPQVIKTPYLACELVYTKIFRTFIINSKLIFRKKLRKIRLELITVTAMFSKNNIIFVVTS